MTRLIQITAYVRDETDLAKWRALSNKTQWLHDKLESETLMKLKGIQVEARPDVPEGMAYLMNKDQLKAAPIEPTITPAEETL